MTKPKPLPPIDELRKRLAYRSDGVLIWKRPFGHKVKAGSVAGNVISSKRLQVSFNGLRHYAHRIIWAIVKREDPFGFDIDHINGNPLDNKIKNLRKATTAQNQHNKLSRGYAFDSRRQKFKVCIRKNKKHVFVGYFDTEKQAREAYLRAKEKLHGEFMPPDMKHELGQIDGPTSQLTIFDD